MSGSVLRPPQLQQASNQSRSACSSAISRLAGHRVSRHACARQAGKTSIPHDVVLSSGFLAFAQHAGFLQAVEEAGVVVRGVMGTSAGALTGSLYAAGYSPREVAHFLSEKPPIQLLQPCFEPWKGGVLSLEGVVQRLSELLPPTFEGLQREFAVGVVTPDGEHVLIDEGPLPAAVAASAAIPFIFSAVDVPGGLSGLKDGGMVDRVGLSAWRRRRRTRSQHSQGQRLLPPQPARSSSPPVPPCLVHVIERSSPFSGADNPESSGEGDVHIVRCPKSGVNFFDLGDFERQFEAAQQRTSSSLDSYINCVQQLGVQQRRQAVASAAPTLWDGQQQPPQRVGGTVVLPAARRPAAATVVASSAVASRRVAASRSSINPPVSP